MIFLIMFFCIGAIIFLFLYLDGRDTIDCVTTSLVYANL